MARSVLKGAPKARKRASKPRTSKDLDMQHVGFAPKWDDIDSPEHPDYNRMLRYALYHYDYFFSVKDLKKHVAHFLSTEVGMDAESVRLYGKTADWRTPLTACSLAAAIHDGMPYTEAHKNYILKNVNSAIDHLAEDNPSALAKPTKKREKTIQERLREKLDEHILHFEEIEDCLIEKKTGCSEPEAYEYFKIHDVPVTMLNKIEELFNARWQEILTATAKGADPDLKEYYAHMTKKDVERFSDFYSALLADLEMFREEKKVARKPRRRKPVSKEKQVAKVKYLRSFEPLKLVSINPTEVIDAKVLWVYNTKTRKLGVYHANDMDGGFGFKGTTLTGFDTNNSRCKTLRKPKEQLAAFKKSGKVKLRKFLDEIKAVEIKLTGRINKDTILLKAY